MSQRTYAVAGMTCAHCIRSVTAEVGSPSGVESVVVHLGRGSVGAAIDKAGYELVGAVS